MDHGMAEFELVRFLEKEIVAITWGDYDGIQSLPLAKLGALRVLVDAAINEKLQSQMDATQPISTHQQMNINP